MEGVCDPQIRRPAAQIQQKKRSRGVAAPGLIITHRHQGPIPLASTCRLECFSGRPLIAMCVAVRSRAAQTSVATNQGGH